MFPNEIKNHPKRKGEIKPFRVIMSSAFAVTQFRYFGAGNYRGAIRMAVKSGIEKFNINGSQKPMLLKLS